MHSVRFGPEKVDTYAQLAPSLNDPRFWHTRTDQEVIDAHIHQIVSPAYRCEAHRRDLSNLGIVNAVSVLSKCAKLLTRKLNSHAVPVLRLVIGTR